MVLSLAFDVSNPVRILLGFDDNNLISHPFLLLCHEHDQKNLIPKSFKYWFHWFI